MDTARYQEDHMADRLTDIAHARSEILSAMLFGYEVVIPAGAIADCPALIELIPEVMNNAGEHIDKIGKQSRIDFRLFRIGLEEKYLKLNGLTGYSAFVADYLKSKLGAEPPLVALIDLARNSGWNQQTVPAILGKAYVDRDWKAIDQLGKDIAGASGDNGALERFEDYRNYAQTVFHFLEPGIHNSQASRPLFSPTNFISQTPPAYYHEGIGNLLDTSAHRKLAERDFEKERMALQRVYEEMVGNGANPAERGSWYRYEAIFKNEGVWGYLRNWLDVLLYDRLRDGFDVRVPSYFTQELDACSEDLSMTLALTPLNSVGSFIDDLQLQTQPFEHPAEFEVDWEPIWQLIAEKGYQVSLAAMTERYKDALACEEQELATITSENAADIKREKNLITQKRRARMVAAFDDHIQFLNEQVKNFKLVNRNGKIIAKRSLTIPTRKAAKLGVNLLTAGMGAEFVPEHVFDKFIDVFSGKVVDHITGELVEDVWERDIRSPSVINAVKRPRNTLIQDRQSFIAANRDRINLWIST